MLAIIAVAILSRVVTFGNPVVIADDQFYLLVGDAMRHGQWPYIDIWDRKPFGLFALFEGIAALGNGSILAMQLIATAFAAATALVIRRMALFLTNERGALFGAIAYLIVLPLFGGGTAQSPVFYNLFTALAGWALFAAVGRDIAAIRWRAFAAMLTCGLSLTIKPVALIEGIFFGLAFVALLHRSGVRPLTLALTALAMVATALLPSLLPLIIYAIKGRDALDAYMFANYVSIFLKNSLGSTARLAGLAFFLIYAVPSIAIAARGVYARRADFAGEIRLRLAIAWLVAAIGGWLLIPNFFDQYALPMFVPLSLLGALGFGLGDGALYLVAYLVCALADGRLVAWNDNRRDVANYQRLATSIDVARHGGCLFVADGPAWLYHDIPPCPLTRFLFPGHLTSWSESTALGIDQSAELARVLAYHPAVIVTQEGVTGTHNRPVQGLIYGTLNGDYRKLLELPHGTRGELDALAVWQRRDLLPPG